MFYECSISATGEPNGAPGLASGAAPGVDWGAGCRRHQPQGGLSVESAILGLKCAHCTCGGVNSDATRHPLCPTTGLVQEAVYDLATVKRTIDRDRLKTEPRGMWRFRAMLPIRDPAHVVTLQEGDTPLLHARRAGDALGLKHLYIKDDTRNPTGSFKDRGASVTFAKCLEVGHGGVVLASSGNAATAFATYAARARLRFVGLVRHETSAVHRLQTQIHGGEIYVVEGTMVEGTRLAQAVADRDGLFHGTQPYNLYRAEGKKTLAYEISEALGWRVPDRILLPTAGGTNALALHQGYRELNALGWVTGTPALDVVQAAGSQPIVRAFTEGTPVRRDTGTTKLVGLGHPFPSAGDRIVAIMKETGARGWAVSDKDAFAAARLLAREEGMFMQPASAAALAGFLAIGRERTAKEYGEQLIVAIATGSGKNQVDEPLVEIGEPPVIAADLAAFDRARSQRPRAQ
ncbi:MAG: pyridoxal-phosphate dependent enzyme [Alphaproteobacteria bacterium]|nr:pyridoxal-phosphate dependent enzyme [Alphaproteobacteria bacterium]